MLCIYVLYDSQNSTNWAHLFNRDYELLTLWTFYVILHYTLSYTIFFLCLIILLFSLQSLLIMHLSVAQNRFLKQWIETWHSRQYGKTGRFKGILPFKSAWQCKHWKSCNASAKSYGIWSKKNINNNAHIFHNYLCNSGIKTYYHVTLEASI